MSWVAAGIAGGTALLKTGIGLYQNSQANGIDANNPYPTYTPQNEYQQNVDQAQQMAQEGTPLASYNAQKSAIGANQATALNAVGKSANPTNVAAIVRQGNAATGQLNAQDAIQRNRNMLTLLQERQQLAQQKDKAWDWNYQQKYLGNLAKSQALRTSGNSNLGGALNDVAGLATAVAGNGGFGSGDSGFTGGGAE